MPEPAAHPRIWLVAFATFCVVLTGCQRQAQTPTPPATVSKSEPPPIAPPPPPALSRAELLRAMEDAAAAYAAGRAPDDDGLAGRRFTVRQAFGCFGPSLAPEDPADGLARWSWNDKHDQVELSLTPEDWKGSALVAGAAPNWEAVEGLWLLRPWLQTDGCPGVAPDPLASGPLAPSPQTMGLAAVFEAGGSRLGRRNGRAYSFIVRGKDGKPPAAPADGYRLVLEGRLASFSDGRAIHCRAESPDQRPVCIAAARLDRVAFEDASGVMLSEWRPG